MTGVTLALCALSLAVLLGSIIRAEAGVIKPSDGQVFVRVLMLLGMFALIVAAVINA